MNLDKAGERGRSVNKLTEDGSTNHHDPFATSVDATRNCNWVCCAKAINL